MLFTMMENKKGFTNVLITFLKSWSRITCSVTISREKNRNLSKTFMLFYEASGHTFYKQTVCSN